jgi:mRNA-degrading endonuclease RelE of RelBE toxin-antitoxin system
MDYHFTRLKVGYPEPLTAPPDHDYSWKVYTICKTDNKTSCTTRSDVNLLCVSDKYKARSCFLHIINNAQTGRQFSDLYDEKQCHEAFSFKHNENNQKIFRVRCGAIRVYFIYLPNKKILLLKTLAKRSGNITKKTKNEIIEIATAVLELNENEFKRMAI